MLPQRLPTEYTEVTDGGVTVLPLRTDFICWMRFEELITDCRIPEDRLVITALRLIFPVMPRDLSRAAMFMLWFYRCGEPPKEAGEGGAMLSSRRAYSFETDFPMIAAAFYEKYGIDLWETKMHWWKFRGLFMGLHDCRFTDICGWRTADISDDMPDYRREFLEKMQQVYALPVSANELRMIEAARRFLDS